MSTQKQDQDKPFPQNNSRQVMRSIPNSFRALPRGCRQSFPWLSGSASLYLLPHPYLISLPVLNQLRQEEIRFAGEQGWVVWEGHLSFPEGETGTSKVAGKVGKGDRAEQSRAERLQSHLEQPFHASFRHHYLSLAGPPKSLQLAGKMRRFPSSPSSITAHPALLIPRIKPI